MDSLTKALDIISIGGFVFPISPGGKTPLTPNGHINATDDVEIAAEWFQNEYPDARVGVHCGRSGWIALDVDLKPGINGFDNLTDSWLEVPSTFRYPTLNKGEHHIYAAPEGVRLNGQSKYLGIEGVDRRAGSSYIVWWGDTVPSSRDAFAPAPEWLCAPAEEKTGAGFLGQLDEWLESLTPGEPNVLVRSAMERTSDDLSHSEMVERQLNLIRLGSEGNPGVQMALDQLFDEWMGRDAQNHSTPAEDWAWKFDEALHSGVQKFGAPSALFNEMPAYSVDLVPSSVDLSLVVGEPGSRENYSLLLSKLVEATDDNLVVLSILWNAPKTRLLSREWGLEFLYNTRIPAARKTPEPERENPSLEAAAEDNGGWIGLLTRDEQEYIRTRPTFIDRYQNIASTASFSNPIYARAAAWQVLSMAFGFHMFLPVSSTHKMGCNLWNITLGYSGTGKSYSRDFVNAVLRAYFEEDLPGGHSYHLGGDSSPQGLHDALLARDKRPSRLFSDEASKFLKGIVDNPNQATLPDHLSEWYDGWVAPSSKVRLADKSGKSALTSFNIHMYATPDRFTAYADRDMFLSGFMARMTWLVGDPPVETDDRFKVSQQDKPGAFTDIGPQVEEIIGDLAYVTMNVLGEEPVPVLADQASLDRIAVAHKRMFTLAKGRGDWSMIEPSITRLAETLRKCAALNAVYAGRTRVRIGDVLNALKYVEEWYNNLFTVASMVEAGTLQRDANRIYAWIVEKGGDVTETKLYHQFQSMIIKDPRELESRLTLLLRTGRVNRVEEAGKVPRYKLNGGVIMSEGESNE